MPDGAKTLLVLLLIPFLLGLGHDIYFNYFSDDEKIRAVKALRINPEEFLISDAGWVWNTYSPTTMETARDTIAPDTWASKIDPILQLPTMVVGLIPWAVVLLYLSFAWLVGIWPCESRISLFNKRPKKDDYAVYKNAKAKAVKYNKK